MRNKLAQAWGIDLMIAAVIFFTGMIVFLFFMLNQSGEGEIIFNDLSEESVFVANSLVSEGSPLDWNGTDVSRIGLMSGNRINQTKLDRFDSFVQADYNRTRNLFRIKDNYYISFPTGIVVNGNSVSNIGFVPTEYENLVKTTRVVVYEGSIISMEVYIWS